MATNATIKRAASILARHRASKRTPEQLQQAAKHAANTRWERLRECAKAQKKVIL